MTKTDKTMLSDRALEEIFAAGRATAPEPSATLMAGILADADTALAARAAPAPLRAGGPRVGSLGRILSGLGGWPAVAGMVTATIAGAWIGFASPDQLNALAGGVLLPAGESGAAYELEDILPADGGLSALFEEG